MRRLKKAASVGLVTDMRRVILDYVKEYCEGSDLEFNDTYMKKIYEEFQRVSGSDIDEELGDIADVVENVMHDSLNQPKDDDHVPNLW